MKVKLVFIQEFYKIIGRFEVEADLEEGATVLDAIRYVDERVHKGFKDLVLDDGEVKYPVEIAVNGRRIDFLDGLHTKLNEGDTVLFSPRALFIV
ncbi:MAG: MoaD/ThiS family protein [Desulfurococcales archaeon]|nr:MoaD/ThiS family protein [Desulfurococcales archaeon]